MKSSTASEKVLVSIEKTEFHLTNQTSGVSSAKIKELKIINFNILTETLQNKEVGHFLLTVTSPGLGHYENMPTQYKEIFKVLKNENFLKKIFFFFLFRSKR